jgi:spore germination cell wall hydrolase CwlJ-like protein
MRTLMRIIVAVFALTVSQLGHAETDQPGIVDHVVTQTRDTLDNLVQLITEPWITFKVTKRDQECLARNIFYEAGSEPEEGKAAVGIVTINRVKDSRFGRSICDVVNQRTVTVKTHDVSNTEIVHTGWFGRPEEVVHHTIQMQSVAVCQFSWVCQFIRKPKADDERWQESQQVAENLLNGDYEEYRSKYSEALFFHSTGVRPVWAKQKQYVSKIGGHIFYAEK